MSGTEATFATGPRAGAAVQRLGRDPTVTAITDKGRFTPIPTRSISMPLRPPQPATASARIPLRYVLRPPIAQDALAPRPTGIAPIAPRPTRRQPGDSLRAYRVAGEARIDDSAPAA